MGGKVASSAESRKHRPSFTEALGSALFEWLLIFMLLLYGMFGYLITKFAHYCELPIPCLLCSRIDHLLGSEKVEVFRDMICGDHKLKLSSLVFCHFHEKLVDVRGMCESCLFSFAMKDKSNAETYRILVGKLGVEDLSGSDDDSLLDDQKPRSLSMKRCSCCLELWTPSRHVQTLLKTNSVGFDASDLDIPLSREFSLDRDNLVKEAKILHEVADVRRASEDSPQHRGYTELKIASDTDSEIQASDNEDTRYLMSNDPMRDLILESTPMEPLITMSEEESVCNREINVEAIAPETSQIICQVESDIMIPQEAPSVASNSAIGHGLEELNWQKIEHIANHSLTELKTGNPVSESSNPQSTITNVPKDGYVEEASSTPKLFQETDIVQVSETLHNNRDQNNSKMNSDNNDGSLQFTNYMDLVDAYKLAIGSRGRQLSSKLTEQLAAKDPSKVSSDLKLLLSQLSRGIELTPNDVISPRFSRNIDELKPYDTSSTIGMKILQKRLSLERNDSRSSLDRNESGVESLDFSMISEIEGESEPDRLKRQVEQDRKIMSALLKELEEERSASAIAAHEAMAMITRLQEEKAALQMEASQGLRMMEEQAEYDMEALEKLNEMVAEKEKEIQELENELDYYRIKYSDETLLDDEEESGAVASQDV